MSAWMVMHRVSTVMHRPGHSSRRRFAHGFPQELWKRRDPLAHADPGWRRS
jgi:hypothetical protein